MDWLFLRGKGSEMQIPFAFSISSFLFPASFDAVFPETFCVVPLCTEFDFVSFSFSDGKVILFQNRAENDQKYE